MVSVTVVTNQLALVKQLDYEMSKFSLLRLSTFSFWVPSSSRYIRVPFMDSCLQVVSTDL